MCAPPAKSRSISLPLDLEAQISIMLSSPALNSLSRSNPNYKSPSRSSRPVAPSNPWDYKNIIEKLQVVLLLLLLLSLQQEPSQVIKLIDHLQGYVFLLFDSVHSTSQLRSTICMFLGQITNNIKQNNPHSKLNRNK